jgi:hypothetical protein
MIKKCSIVISVILIVAPVLLSWGCESIVQVDLPGHTPRLVVNGIFANDSDWYINLSQSVDVLGNEEPRAVNNARMEIWLNNAPITTLSLVGDGVYSSGARPRAGLTYELRVSVPGFNSVSAQGTIPPTPVIDAVTAVPERTPYGYQNYRITVQLADPGDQKNYYEVFVLFRDNFGEWFTTTINSNDPAITETNASIEIGEKREFFGDAALVEDALFNGSSYDLQFETITWSEIRDINVVVSAISETVFRHNRAYRLHDETDDNPFAEPVQLYSNIQNGYGIFGGVNPRSFIFNVSP